MIDDDVKMTMTMKDIPEDQFDDGYNSSEKARQLRSKDAPQYKKYADEIADIIEDLVLFMPDPRQYFGKLLTKQYTVMRDTEQQLLEDVLKSWQYAYKTTVKKYKMDSIYDTKKDDKQ